MSDSDLKIKNFPCFNAIKEQLLSDVVGVWQKTGLPMLSTQKLATKLKYKESEVDQEWLQRLLDICCCKCHILENSAIHKEKMQCSCDVENRITEKKKKFFKDISHAKKRRSEKMNINWKRDIIRHEQQPCTFSTSSSDFVTSLKFISKVIAKAISITWNHSFNVWLVQI